MGNLKNLKKELKEAKKDLKKNKTNQDIKDLIDILEKEIKLKKNIKSKGYKSSLIDKIQNKFSEYEPQAKVLDKVKYIGHNLISFRFDASEYRGGNFSKNKVLNISKKMSKYLKSKGIDGKISTAVKHPNYDWRSGYITTIGNKLEIYDPTKYYDVEPDPDDIKYESFVIYTVIKPKAQGGNDMYNDCLYNCLKYMIYEFDKFFDSPDKLKKYLGLKRVDKIPLNLIEKIENKLSTYQINVRGDYIYTSTIKSNKVINLLLQNEHYTVDTTAIKPLLNKSVRYYEKKPILYDKLTFEGYDGEIKRKLTIEERNEILYSFSSQYILFDREEQKRGIQIPIEEEFKKLIEDINKLKTLSNGFINMYKTGNINNTCLEVFDKMTRFLIEPETILQDEAIWINEATTGSLIWGHQYNGDVYKYDIKSHYPHLMTSKGKFPIKRGSFEKLKELPLDYYRYGIYRVIIHPSEDENINKLFRFSYNDYYTHTSLEHAKKLNLKIELINDNEPNYLYYSPDKLISFEEVFKPYVMYLFNLKNQGANKAKDILNRLWGRLGEYDRSKKYDEKEININEDEEITELRPCNKNENVNLIKTNKINKPYKTNYARLIPFLKAMDRKKMSEHMFEYRNNIHQILTDGFLCDKLIHSKIDVKLGELKYEGKFENITIKNCSKVV